MNGGVAAGGRLQKMAELGLFGAERLGREVVRVHALAGWDGEQHRSQFTK